MERDQQIQPRLSYDNEQTWILEDTRGTKCGARSRYNIKFPKQDTKKINTNGMNEKTTQRQNISIKIFVNTTQFTNGINLETEIQRVQQ